jgi:hypothetical protein
VRTTANIGFSLLNKNFGSHAHVGAKPTARAGKRAAYGSGPALSTSALSGKCCCDAATAILQNDDEPQQVLANGQF